MNLKALKRKYLAITWQDHKGDFDAFLRAKRSAYSAFCTAGGKWDMDEACEDVLEKLPVDYQTVVLMMRRDYDNNPLTFDDVETEITAFHQAEGLSGRGPAAKARKADESRRK